MLLKDLNELVNGWLVANEERLLNCIAKVHYVNAGPCKVPNLILSDNVVLSTVIIKDDEGIKFKIDDNGSDILYNKINDHNITIPLDLKEYVFEYIDEIRDSILVEIQEYYIKKKVS